MLRLGRGPIMLSGARSLSSLFMRFAILFVALALATATPAVKLDESELLGTDDCTVMQDAFIQGQRGLIAEFKVATLAVANAVLPGFDFDISVSTTTAHPNTNATCPNPPPEFPLFILNQFQVSAACLLVDLIKVIGTNAVLAITPPPILRLS